VEYMEGGKLLRRALRQVGDRGIATLEGILD
jgi:hypothetical protein